MISALGTVDARSLFLLRLEFSLGAMGTRAGPWAGRKRPCVALRASRFSPAPVVFSWGAELAAGFSLLILVSARPATFAVRFPLLVLIIANSAILATSAGIFGIAVFTGTALLANAALLAAAQIVPFFAFANVIVVLGPVVSADTAGAVRRVALLASV